jgi:hypothetical protein
MRKLIAILWTLTIACGPAPEPEVQAYEIDWTLLAETGDCADWKLDDPDTIYVPTEGSPACTPLPEPSAGVWQGSVECPVSDELFISNTFYYELETGGEAYSTSTITNPSTEALICFLDYEGTVTELP